MRLLTYLNYFDHKFMMASVGDGCSNNSEVYCNCSSYKHKMNDSSSDHRRSMSENTNGSQWSQCWDNEDESLSRLNMESSEELEGLMEDREIAARAVAFVVNSTRKGFVALCASVASLMRSKQRLEKKVERLKHEVEILRSLNGNDVSKRPTPTSLSSLSSDKDFFMDPAHLQIFNELLKENYRCNSTSCSRSSGGSSQLSNSPKPTKKRSKDLPKTTTSPMMTIPATKSDSLPQLVTVLVHRSDDNDNDTSNEKLAKTKNASPENDRHHRSDESSRKSLPPKKKNCENGCHKNGRKMDDRKNVAKKQCGSVVANGGEPACEDVNGSERHLDDNDDESLNILVSKDFERLSLRLKDYEISDEVNYASSTSSIYPIETVTMDTVAKQRSSSASCAAVVVAPPLDGCLCSACLETVASHQILRAKAKPSSDSFPVQLNNRIIVKGDKVGQVRYLGHIDDESNGGKNEIFIGLELHVPGGNSDGIFAGKRYFTCDAKRGMFVPLSDFVSIAAENQEDSFSVSSRLTKASINSKSSNRSHSRPLHRSKALKQINTNTYMQSIETDDPDDRYLV